MEPFEPSALLYLTGFAVGAAPAIFLVIAKILTCNHGKS